MRRKSDVSRVSACPKLITSQGGAVLKPLHRKKRQREERQGEAERKRYPLLDFNDGSLREGLLPETCHPSCSQGSAQE